MRGQPAQQHVMVDQIPEHADRDQAAEQAEDLHGRPLFVEHAYLLCAHLDAGLLGKKADHHGVMNRVFCVVIDAGKR